MIDAFTRLKDYNAGVEQHTEIINRDPDDEAKVDNAITYKAMEVVRSCVIIISSCPQKFKKLSLECRAAKMPKLTAIQKKLIRNYKSAIVNQPEMEDLSRDRRHRRRKLR